MIENVFDVLTHYGEGYTVKSKRHFTNNEIAAVRMVKAVRSQHGMSACFFMVGGGQTYIPLSRDTHLDEGTIIDITKASLLVLNRAGDGDILRLEVL